MIYEHLTPRLDTTGQDPLTPEQERLYARLVENNGFAGNAAQLAAFADLRYPFDPNIVYGLTERKLIKHNAINVYWLTIVEEE